MWIWPLAVALLSLIVAVVAIMMIIRSARAAQENEQQLHARIEILESELSAMMDGAFGVANHLQKVESNLKSTVQRQEQIQQRDMGNLPYNEAVRLASKGADVSELVEHCGLSRSEAELVEMLHKKSPPVIDFEHEETENSRSKEDHAAVLSTPSSRFVDAERASTAPEKSDTDDKP